MAAMSRIKKADLTAWYARNARENADHTLVVGDWVRDQYGGWGKVTSISVPRNPTMEDHGSITVDQSVGYCHFGGFDSEEHYTWFNWKSFLRRIAAPVQLGSRQHKLEDHGCD